ncbi:hypothetical protein C8F04DRAFT_1187725 [Mycena alexandri]|uniref:Uncharacterized protein n=1 Tax=Mycena alexandri TaxID=1745969 RepID=A0AAD6WY27_9AGAR|nr:hypothetical protein C8F04DRAFT_1187725 [Mycena alexandri]
MSFSLYITAWAPPSNGLQGAPIRMRTGFPKSKCAHREEAERRACAVLNTKPDTIGLVPKPEPESDTEPDTVERQTTGTASSKTPGRCHSGPPGVWATPEELASVR